MSLHYYFLITPSFTPVGDPAPNSKEPYGFQGPSHVVFQILGFRKNWDFTHFYGFQGAFLGISGARGGDENISPRKLSRST